MRLVTATACSMVFGFLALASGLGLIPSTAIPLPGAEITLQVAGAPAGAQFKWDFNGDGRPDATTSQPWASWIVPAGPWEVVVDVVHGGQPLARLSTMVVADARGGAIREVRWTQSAVEVTVTFLARTRIMAPGLTVDVPPGWVVTARDPSTVNEQGQLEILPSSAMELYPGQELTVSYVLYPPSSGARARLMGWVTGFVGMEGRVERVTIPVAGPVSF
ncbi:MAG: hypothetical protein Kow0097_14010 [Candidatus Bipolaricaulota bacterium]|nr:hypothetical protein [Candidatus Bipolaricaulota bacterium]